MKALTLIRPWSWAIVASTKRIENRTWRPNHILFQRIAIHAGMKFDENAAFEIARIQGHKLDQSCEDQGIVGTAVVSGFVSSSPDPWFCGPVGWVLTDVVRLPQPIPCKGAQGLWQVPDDIIERIH